MSLPQKTCTNQNAERLKNQGNELHQKRQYRAAYRKYSDAIKEDPTNAIYYANSAATSLALNECVFSLILFALPSGHRYMDASGDARKATELDPTYAKAWGRLGTASSKLSRWSQSVDAWKKALDCLPKDESATELDKRLRIQFNESLKEAEEALTAPIRAPVFYEAPKGTEMPWHRAKDWEQKLITANKMSSAFVILRAYEEFTSGVETLKKVEQKVVNGQLMWYGKPTALVDLTNGIMRDRRSFHFDSDWIDTYNKQVIFECEMFQAWTDGGAKKVQAEAPQRLKKQGWQPVRQALSTIIRAWVMSGFMASATGRYLAAFEFFSRAVEVVKSGTTFQ